jgi:hypothetical protein
LQAPLLFLCAVLVNRGLSPIVHDQNAYGNMSEVLKAIGITTKTAKDYNTQFGISLNKRSPQEVVPAGVHLLMADTSTAITPESTQAQLNQLQADFNIQPGEVNMLIMDMPGVPPQQAPIIMAQAAQPSTKELYGTVGVCYLTSKVNQIDPEKDKEGYYVISPQALADNLLSSEPPTDAAAAALNSLDYHNAEVTVLQPPKHGSLSQDLSPGKDVSYYPNSGYVGNDKVIFLVNIEGYKIKVVYFIKVLSGTGSNTPETLYHKYCPSPSWWQISTATGNANLLASQLAPSLFGFGQTPDTVTFADLPGGAVGETTGTSITLDTNAAGYGWYVDPNPAANTDFLPTSNPDVWMAKAGSAAAGKMDMLSVLLHEYGHALGLDHSANPNDFMAPDLQPGERRLPSASELAQLSQLATQLASGNSTPSNPASPALPVGTALSALLIGRLRRTDYGSLTPVITSAQIPAPQFELAINSTLTNSNFTSGTTDWNAYGNVTTNSTGTATLKNSTGADAQLAQAFNITSSDRYIEFTVTNGLQKGSGPADAFEVALDNAVTGTALVGTDGLTNSDGLLNIQADGTTHAASSVYKSVNADGTTTYVIDLQSALGSGAVTSTPAALSFDLKRKGDATLLRRYE